MTVLHWALPTLGLMLAGLCLLAAVGAVRAGAGRSFRKSAVWAACALACVGGATAAWRACRPALPGTILVEVVRAEGADAAAPTAVTYRIRPKAFSPAEMTALAAEIAKARERIRHPGWPWKYIQRETPPIVVELRADPDTRWVGVAAAIEAVAKVDIGTVRMTAGDESVISDLSDIQNPPFLAGFDPIPIRLRETPERGLQCSVEDDARWWGLAALREKMERSPETYALERWVWFVPDPGTRWSDLIRVHRLLRDMGFAKVGIAPAVREGAAVAVTSLLKEGSHQAPEVSVFGLSSRADHIVYVVDRSGSLLDALDEVRTELVKSITRLSASQSFELIFMHSDKPKEGPRNRLVFATVENKRAANEFLKTIQAMGQTDPVSALQRAFDVLAQPPGPNRARIIYLMTNNELPNAVWDVLVRGNADGQVQVNTILLFYKSPAAMKMFRAIADENGGTFKFVEAKE